MKKDKSFLNRKINLKMYTIMINDLGINRNLISKFPVEVEDSRGQLNFKIYNINANASSCYSTSKNIISKYLGFGYKPFDITFIADSTLSIAEINDLLDHRIKTYGPEYFNIPKAEHEYIVDWKGRYYKIYGIIKDISYLNGTYNNDYILYKCLYGNYDFKVENLIPFINRFPEYFAYFGSTSDRYPKKNDMEMQPYCQHYNKVKEPENEKNELYKFVRYMKKYKYILKKSKADKSSIEQANRIIKQIKQDIKKIKESGLELKN